MNFTPDEELQGSISFAPFHFMLETHYRAALLAQGKTSINFLFNNA